MVLVSTGDHESSYQDLANEIASHMKESGRYDDVYFSGWQRRHQPRDGATAEAEETADNHSDRAIERLHDAVTNCTVALLITSPFGKTSYEELLAKRELSTWRDAFVIGSRAIFTQPFVRSSSTSSTYKGGKARRARKIVVAYAAEPGERLDKFVHKDFAAAAGRRLYNLLNASDRQRAYKSLLGIGVAGKSMKAPNDCLLKYKNLHHSSNII